MISLQDYDDVPANLFLPPLIVSIFLPLLVTKINFVFCQNYDYYFFFKNAVGDATSRRKKAGSNTYFLSVSFHSGLHGVAYLRTVGGRSDGSDVIAKPKFLALMGLPKSLSYGAPRASAFGARGAPL